MILINEALNLPENYQISYPTLEKIRLDSEESIDAGGNGTNIIDGNSGEILDGNGALVRNDLMLRVTHKATHRTYYLPAEVMDVSRYYILLTFTMQSQLPTGEYHTQLLDSNRNVISYSMMRIIENIEQKNKNAIRKTNTQYEQE